MSNPWFRMYGDTINNPKALRLSDATFRGWIMLLCVASNSGGTLPPMADLEIHLRMKPQRIAALLAELVRAELFDKLEGGGFKPHNWDKRQYKSDNSTDRVKRFRERQRNVSSDVSATPPEAESRNRSRAEAEQSAPRAAQVDLVEEALRADLREFLGSNVDLARVSDWIGKGYDPGMVREVVRELRRRKPDVASLAYFDTALAERHAKRPPAPAERTSVDWDAVVSMFAHGGPWSRYAGPEPGLAGCRAPRETLAKHGINPTTGQRVRRAG